MVGNGITDYHYDVWPAFVPTVYNFNLIKEDLYEDFEVNDCFFTFNRAIPYNNTFECVKAFAKIRNLTDNLNWYDLYRQVYPDSLLRDENAIGEVEINGEKRTY